MCIRDSRTTMCIFLSVQQIKDVAQELIAGGYPPETSVVVVEKASWPGQQIVQGNLSNIAPKVTEAGITKTALIMVGDVFSGPYERSKLYDPCFSHGCREAKKPEGK